MAGKKGARDKLFSSPTMVARWRAGVQVGLIRDRLNKQALDQLKIDAIGPTERPMSKSAIKAAELLLARCIPTVSATEVTGKDGAPLAVVDATKLASMDEAQLAAIATALDALVPK